MPKYQVVKPFSKIVSHKKEKTFKVGESSITITSPVKKEFLVDEIAEFDNIFEIAKYKMYGLIKEVNPEDFKKKRGRPFKEKAVVPPAEEKAVL